MKLTQYGHHHIIPEDFYRAPGNEVEGGENIPTVDKSVTRWSVGGLESDGQSPQAAFVGATKGFAVLQQTAIQVKADVRLETLRKTF